MLYCKWTGTMCEYVDPETGVCGTVSGECVKEDT